MDSKASKLKLLERMLLDANAEPTRLPLSLLKNITNNFSDDRKIGSGGFSVVYKGLLQNGTVAVKKLSQMADIDEKIFKQEVTSMTMAKHKNIVRFLGYCADTQGEVENYKGKVVIADVRQRLLCFEFFPNGSLDGYITDASEGFEWRTRYKIIKGICEGLHYLHQKNIVHLDLKPANILLNYNMVPKISDFGLSRCFDEKQSRTITSKLIGTLGYLAPESYGGKITVKSDIYSLGVIIIEILTGQKGYPEIENVLESWESRSKKSYGDTQLEQVRVCTKIAVECIDYNPDKRPKTQDIIETLDEMERTYGFIEADLCTSSATHEKTCSNDWQRGTPKVQGETSSEAKVSSSICEVDKVQSMAVSAAPSQLPLIISVPKGSGETSTEICSLDSSENTKLLDIHPMELRFPFEPNKLIECPVTLTNGTDHYVGSWIIPTNQDTHSNLCFSCSSLFHMVEPRSTLVVYMTIKEQQQQPLTPRDTGMFEVLMIIMDSKEDLRNLKSSIGIMPSFDDDFLRRVKELGGGVHRVMLTAVICDPASCLEVIYNQKFIPVTSEYGDISCIDVHPIETWLLVGHGGGCVSIWNYETQEKGIELVTKRSGMLSLFTQPCLVCSAKFIAKEKWFATGDGDGWVHVYAYTKDRVKEFKAHHGRHISSMAVHPTKPFLLMSSFTDTLIKLWDWSQGWKCTQTFDVPNMHVCRLKWNPSDNNTFASVCSETVIVWEIHSADPTATLVGSKKADFFYNDNNRHFMVTSVQGTNYCAYIRDLQTGECVHKLGMVNRIIGDVACHPTLPILVTSGLYDETVFLWDARTFRLEKTIHFTEYVQDMLFIDTKDSTRLFVRCKNGIANVEINLPSLKTDLRTGCGSEEVHPLLPGSN